VSPYGADLQGIVESLAIILAALFAIIAITTRLSS
jgi:hypothetical protein